MRIQRQTLTQIEDNIAAKPGPALKAESMVRLDPSQKRLFDDDARVIAVNWHRQKGKDFVTAGKAVRAGMVRPANWYIVSLTQRQADATFAKAEKFFSAYKKAFGLVGEATRGGEEYAEFDATIQHTFTRQARKLILPNGSEIVSLPGKNPDTLAGLTGNIVLTEFGLFPGGGYEHWRVVFPLTTRGYQAVAISTPRSKKTKFFELCSDPETYSYHFCPLSKSVAEDGYQLFDNKGNPCTIEQFRKIYNDESGWAREYECQFTGDASALIAWAQILASQDADLQTRVLVLDGREDHAALLDVLAALRGLPAGRLELGWDVARSGHLSPLWINHAAANGKKRLAALVIMHNVRFEFMRHVISAVMDSRGGSVGCGDATGLGADSNETLATMYRERWEPVVFGPRTKSDLGSLGRTAYGDGAQRLPEFMVSTARKFIATDVYSLQAEPTGDAADKKLVLSETENELEPRSHCDIAYANLLALRAGVLLGGKRGPLPAAVEKPLCL